MIPLACSSSDGGMVTRRARATLVLITSSNFVGCSIGRSPGLAPLEAVTEGDERTHPLLGDVQADAVRLDHAVLNLAHVGLRHGIRISFPVDRRDSR